MKNLYNKGRYRSHEYGKIPSDLRKRGNRLWRITAPQDIKEALDLEAGIVPAFRCRKTGRREIIVRIKHESFGRKSSRTSQYRTMRDAMNAACRNTVKHVFFIGFERKK